MMSLLYDVRKFNEAELIPFLAGAVNYIFEENKISGYIKHKIVLDVPHFLPYFIGTE